MISIYKYNFYHLGIPIFSTKITKAIIVSLAEEVGHGVTTRDNEVKVTYLARLQAEVKWRVVYG